MNTGRIPNLTIISGGQTGVDRGALDAAIALKIPHGGWCPLGRRAEDGTIPDRYELQPTASPDYKIRTEQNVLDTDGTLVLCRGPIRGGTALTCSFARRHRQPCHVVDLSEAPGERIRSTREAIHQWLAANDIRRLNVAGPRESQNPGIEIQTTDFLIEILGTSSNSR